MTFRPAFPADAAAILSLDSIDRVEVWQHVKDGQVFVAEEDHRVIGAVAVIPSGGVSYLASMSVAHDKRGAGIGRKLVRYVEDCVGTPLMAISRDEAQGFWSRCGFSPVARVMEKA
jgi:predicted N-acetyltransferase YhbS